MKRVAISLGSISLVLLNNGYCEPNVSIESFTSSSLSSDAPISIDAGELDDELAFLETDPSELEKELLSLEQELAEQEKASSVLDLQVNAEASPSPQTLPQEVKAPDSNTAQNDLVSFLEIPAPVKAQDNSLEKTDSTSSHVAEQEAVMPTQEAPQGIEDKASVQSDNKEQAPLSANPSSDMSQMVAFTETEALTTDAFEEVDEENSELESDAIAMENELSSSAELATDDETNSLDDSEIESDAIAMDNELTPTEDAASEMPVKNLEENVAAAKEAEVETQPTVAVVSETANEVVAVEEQKTPSLLPMQEVAVAEPVSQTAPASRAPSSKLEISFSQVFSGSPLIYGMLFLLSMASVAIWLYNFFTLRFNANLSDSLLKNVRNKLVSNHYDEALSLCREEKNFFCKMMASGIGSRKYGLQFMLESMKSEGKRASVPFWQRLNLLQDIAIVAPMLGLLGTVLGMFYAFYDLNRSFESISTLFDGLGISVGTTVAGIFVAILAMILHSMSKFRLIKDLSRIENEALTLAHLIDNKTH